MRVRLEYNVVVGNWEHSRDSPISSIEAISLCGEFSARRTVPDSSLSARVDLKKQIEDEICREVESVVNHRDS